MAVENKVPVQRGTGTGIAEWQPFDTLRRQMDRMFEDFFGGAGRWGLPTMRESLPYVAAPAVDVVEQDGAFQITAELPGIDEKNLEVKCSDGTLTIKGEKKDEKEEKQKDYYLSERRFGSFQRSFRIPETVDPDKIEAAFNNGVLTLTLPKSAEAQKREKKIPIKKA